MKSFDRNRMAGSVDSSRYNETRQVSHDSNLAFRILASVLWVLTEHQAAQAGWSLSGQDSGPRWRQDTRWDVLVSLHPTCQSQAIKPSEVAC